MKLDKETMIKQRFWFLLPFVALFLLIAWICVLGVRSTAAENYKKADTTNTQLKAIASTSKLKNNKWIDEMKVEVGVSETKKEQLWYEEYNRQNGVTRDSKDPLKGEISSMRNPFITWPERTRLQWNRTHVGEDLNKKDFGEYLGHIPPDEYREEYPQAFEAVLSVIRDWLDESNPGRLEGAVRVPGNSLRHRENARVHLLRPRPLNMNALILSDEAWLLKEDLAVKRELFQSLNDLLTSYSKMKPEWSEVEFKEIKAAATPPVPPPPPAAAAPAGTTGSTLPADAAVAAASAPPTEGAPAPAAPPKSDEPPVLSRYRFYNHVWPNLLELEAVQKDPKLKGTWEELSLPNAEQYKGWRLDLLIGQDERDEKKLVLRPVSANHSDKFTLPTDVQLAVWYEEIGGAPAATPLIITDAGGIGPCEYWPNTVIPALKRVSEKKLKEIPLPANFSKVLRVTRALPAGTVDQYIAFNDEWLISARMVRRENSPTMTLTGEITNRSGRRLPAASFTAAMLQPNDRTPLFEDFRVPTDAFNAGQRGRFTAEVRNPVLPNKIDFVQQRLTWRTTPIKRIDRLEIGSLANIHSDRLKTVPLVAYDFKRKDPKGENPGSGGGGGTTSMPADGSAGTAADGVSTGTTGGGGRPSGGFGGGGANTEPVTANNFIPTNRYLQVTPQLRRIPVALVMTVDSTAIADIIAAMSNSRLRFQVTMAPWVKVPNLGRPGGAALASAAGGGGGGLQKGGGGVSTVGAGGGGGGGAGGMAVPPPPTGGSGRESADAPGAPGGRNPPRMGPSNIPGGSQPGAARDSGAAAGYEDDSSVVELQIYGIITIYESPDALKRIQSTPPATASTGSTPAAAPTKQ
jgi:hypothetical protein